MQEEPPSFDSEEEVCATATISHTQTGVFNTCLEWIEQQPEAMPMH